MGLKRIQYNTVFNLTTNIRKYTYDIEQYLKGCVSNFKIIPAPGVPDEIEPDIPRFIAQANVNNKIYKFEISQLRVTIIIEKNDDTLLSKLEFDEFIQKVKNIKDELKKVIPNFLVLYEGIVIVDEKIIKNLNEIKLLDNFTEYHDELRFKDSVSFEDKFFITTEKIVVKVFSPENDIPSLSKNQNSTKVGFLEAYVREINNRYLYNTLEGNIDNHLNINEIYSKLVEELNYE